MPVSKHLLAKFSPSESFHVICKSIDGKQLFSTDNKRIYFLQRYHDFLGDFADTYAFCLLNNHVHWLIQIKEEEYIKQFLQRIGKPTSTHKKFLAEECSFHELIEQQFNRFFISYSLSYNISLGIKGHLFNRPFKRIAITDDSHYSQLIVYIHANAQKHGLTEDFSLYKWSSYHAILSDKPTHIKREAVLEWFGGKQRFVEIHKEQAAFYYDHLNAGE